MIYVKSLPKNVIKSFYHPSVLFTLQCKVTYCKVHSNKSKTNHTCFYSKLFQVLIPSLFELKPIKFVFLSIKFIKTFKDAARKVGLKEM